MCEAQVFQCMGHSNWTIFSLLSQFCFPNFSLSYWGLIPITPERGRLKMGKWNSVNLCEAQVFQCLGHSNWTICSLLSQFCSSNFSLSYWGLILITPEIVRLKMGKWNAPNMCEAQVFQCMGHSNWTICQLSQFCSPNF